MRRLAVIAIILGAMPALLVGPASAQSQESAGRSDITEQFSALVDPDAAKREFGLSEMPKLVEIGSPIPTFQFARELAGREVPDGTSLEKMIESGLAAPTEATATLFADDKPIGSARVVDGVVVAFDNWREVGVALAGVRAECCLLELPQIGSELYLVESLGLTAEPIVSASTEKPVAVSELAGAMGERLTELIAAEQLGLSGAGASPLELVTPGERTASRADVSPILLAFVACSILAVAGLAFRRWRVRGAP